jgi:hypothetical protein
LRFVSLSVTESTKPVATLSIIVRASAVGTPTRTPVSGIPWSLASFATSSPSFCLRVGISCSSAAIFAFICSGVAASLRPQPVDDSARAASARGAARP